MVERDRKLVAGIAAGAAVAAAGAATMLAREIGGHRRAGRTLIHDATHPDEEGSGRGEPAGGPDPESRESGYDVKDANVASLVKVIAVALTLMVGSVALVFFVYSRFDRAYQEPNRALTAEQRAPIPPPLPHLQAEPYRDFDAVTMEQSHRLTTFGWNGSDHKTAHIPIERAIQQVIGKPLDGSAQADAAGPKGSDAPQQALPAYNAALPQRKPAHRVQGEGDATDIAPTVTQPLLPGTKP